MANTRDVSHTHGWRRLVVAVIAAGMVVAGTFAAAEEPDAGPTGATPVADCGPGSQPETSIQGRVPQADYDSGRVESGYTCNTEQVAHQGSSGGFKTLRYTDSQGNTCGFYDSTFALGRDVAEGLLTGNGLGVVVLDMNDPANPRQTANLVTPAMLSPHESLLLNEERGLLAAVMGTGLTASGVLDVYDIGEDCQKPTLLSSTPAGYWGHESGWSPDGTTFWTAGAASNTLAAVDVTDPRRPKRIFAKSGVIHHGLRLSDDGKTMYVADMGSPNQETILDDAGLRIYDVSEVQERKPNAEIHVLSDLRWPSVSIPQVAQPFTRDGREYVLEVDEFTDLFGDGYTRTFSRHTPVGAARIIDVTDPRDPFVVSDLRLEVHEPENRDSDLLADPGAETAIQGYSAHYCSLPTRDNPQIAGCSMILSGLRLFDISDLENPREVGYYNKPIAKRALLTPTEMGSWAMSQPAWDAENGSVWYTDTNSGFYVIRLTNQAAPLLTGPQIESAPQQVQQEPAPEGPVEQLAPTPVPGVGSLAVTA